MNEDRDIQWERCDWLEATQHRSRTLTGSIGLEGLWSEWLEGKPMKCVMNRQYQYRRAMDTMNKQDDGLRYVAEGYDVIDNQHPDSHDREYGIIIATLEERETATRIATALNACEGVPNPMPEELARLRELTVSRSTTIASLQAENARLREALQGLVQCSLVKGNSAHIRDTARQNGQADPLAAAHKELTAESEAE